MERSMRTQTAAAAPQAIFRNAVEVQSSPVPVSKNGFSAALAMMGASIAFARDEEVFGEGEAAEYLYQVKTGCIRTSKLLVDGRRQVGAFYLPGDVFGLEAGERHSFSAEAI